MCIIDKCRIAEEDSTGITVEICLNEHRTLLEDLTNNFFTKKIRTRKVETKVGHGYTTGNPFFNNKYLQWFLIITIVNLFHGINQEN